MPHTSKVAEIDLSYFTGCTTVLLLTAEEAEHGYDYTLTYYRSDDSTPLELAKHWTFHNQENADVAAYYMAAKIKEILG